MYEPQCYICTGKSEDLPLEKTQAHYHRYGVGRIFIEGMWELPNTSTIDYLATYHKQWIEPAQGVTDASGILR